MNIFVDMDGVLCQYEKAWNEQYHEEYMPFPQSQVGFFYNLQPIPGALEGIKRLAKKYEVYILTSPSVKNPHCWTEKARWIEERLGFEWLDRLIITKQKGLLHQLTDFIENRTFLIDDQNHGGGREIFFYAGDMYWFAAEDACWSKVEEFFGVKGL